MGKCEILHDKSFKKTPFLIKITRLFFYAFSMNDVLRIEIVIGIRVLFVTSFPFLLTIYKSYVFIAFGFYFTYFFYYAFVCNTLIAYFSDASHTHLYGFVSKKEIKLEQLCRRLSSSNVLK